MSPDDYGRTVEHRGDTTITTTVKPLYQMAICAGCKRRHHHKAVQRVTRTTSTRFGARPSQTEAFWNLAADRKCECGRPIRWRAIAGRKNGTPCSAKCTGSKGFVCNCACGGANHGQGSKL